MIRLTNVTMNELHNQHTITSVYSVTLAQIHAKVNRMFFDILPVVRYDTAGFFCAKGAACEACRRLSEWCVTVQKYVRDRGM